MCKVTLLEHPKEGAHTVAAMKHNLIGDEDASSRTCREEEAVFGRSCRMSWLRRDT